MLSRGRYSEDEALTLFIKSLDEATRRRYEIVFRSLEDTDEKFSNVVAIIEEMGRENKEKAMKRFDFLYRRELKFSMRYLKESWVTAKKRHSLQCSPDVSQMYREKK
ncbi:hypothetical protein Ciccas_011628 [Cichlidogyrus casuarinus]|uniref:Uncharacterized protein n=1 Tax=Cichlidogyrus casuarinus TaxID=1844966 RepID=A0ABD2PRD6_9PLAT